MKKSKSVTLEDVARVAKVSRATVSRVINTPDQVSQEIVERTRAAIQQLRYSPNRFARALSVGKPGTIGLVFFENVHTMFTNPFWGEILDSVYENLAAKNLSCNLIASSSTANSFLSEDIYDDFLSNGTADGYIFFGRYPEEVEKRFGLSHLPIVIFGKPYSNNSEFSFVDTDNVGGATEAVKYLASKGRRKIATITGPIDGGAGFDRYLGYKNGLVESKLKFDPNLVAHGEWTRESGVNAMKTLLKNSPDIDALFVASDLMAVGALEVIQNLKIDVPKQISIISFDNSNLTQLTRPKLTSVSQPFAKIGKELVDAVLKSIEGVSHQSRVLGAEIIQRESS